MNILGINCFAHDTAAALLMDGVPVAFVEEERFNREKHTKAFPDQAIEFCLRTGGITIDEVEVVAFAHRAGTDFRRGAADALKRMPRSTKRLAAQAYIDWSLWRKQERFVRRYGFKGKVANVGHHDAHAASGFFASGFDEAAVLTVDRGGDFISTTLGRGRGNRLETIRELRNPHSLGEIYTAITGWLGFHPNADEGKVMGLAPYGSHRYAPEFRSMVRLRPDGLFRVDLGWFRYQVEAGPLSPRFLKRYGRPRVPESEILPHHKDVAFGVQLLAEETGLHMARALREETAQIGRPFILVMTAELQKIGPGEQSGIVKIIEDDAHRVMSDRFQAHDLHVALARHELTFQRTVALHFGAGRFHPQIFRSQLIVLAIVKRHGEHILGGVELEFGRPRLARSAHACSISERMRASSGSITGISSRIG